MLEVTIYDNTGRKTSTFGQTNGDEVDFVSLVSNETYGPPALVAPNKGQPPTAQIEDRVLYINTGPAGPAMFQIERISD
jgi:hypothetical protein